MVDASWSMQAGIGLHLSVCKQHVERRERPGCLMLLFVINVPFAADRATPPVLHSRGGGAG